MLTENDDDIELTMDVNERSSDSKETRTSRRLLGYDGSGAYERGRKANVAGMATLLSSTLRATLLLSIAMQWTFALLFCSC